MPADLPGAGRAAAPARRLSHLEQPRLCSPHLYTADWKQGQRPRFEPCVALVLSSTGSDCDTWAGRWFLCKQEEDELLHQIDSMSSLQVNVVGVQAALRGGDGRLSMEEMRHFVAIEENRERIKQLPSALHGLLVEEFLSTVFTIFDENGDGRISLGEWHNFLDVMLDLHLQYLLQAAFLSFRAFYGRGQAWVDGGVMLQEADLGAQQQLLRRAAGSMLRSGGSSQAAAAEAAELLRNFGYQNGAGQYPDGLSRAGYINLRPREVSTFQLGVDPDGRQSCFGLAPPGLWADLHYYSANNHPLHGIFACDPNNPLSAPERLGIELATIGFSSFTFALKTRWIEHGEAPIAFLKDRTVFKIFIVTVPGIVIWWVLFLLFTCPKCGHADEANATPVEKSKAKRMNDSGAALGWMLLFLGFCCWLVDIVDEIRGDTRATLLEYLWELMQSRLFGYLFSWGLMVFVYFNPLIAWGQPDPMQEYSLGDYIGLGQWRIEKQRFQMACAYALQNAEPGADEMVKHCKGCYAAPCIGPAAVSVCTVS